MKSIAEYSGVSERIKSFIMEKFPLARKRGVQDSDPLMENGVLDSLGVLDLVTYMEGEFRITVSDDELIPENFRTLESLTTFVISKSAPESA